MAEKQRIPPELRRRVRERARGRCEYCLLHDDDVLFPHEADHVIAEKHGGPTSEDNPAWSCFICNRFKGTDLSSIDPSTGHLAALYNPRRQQWQRHFRLSGAFIQPLTASGRATEFLLRLNERRRFDERAALAAIGRYP